MNKIISFKKFLIESTLSNFLKSNNIDFNNLDNLGSGEYGTAYRTTDDRLLKHTSDVNEFNTANNIIGEDIPGIVKIHSTFKENDMSFYIIKDYLELSDDYGDVEYLYGEVLEILSTVGYSIHELPYFDIDEYEEETGEMDNVLRNFIDGIIEILRMCNLSNIRNVDIGPDNIGYSKDGILTLFDISGE